MMRIESVRCFVGVVLLGVLGASGAENAGQHIDGEPGVSETLGQIKAREAGKAHENHPAHIVKPLHRLPRAAGPTPVPGASVNPSPAVARNAVSVSPRAVQTAGTSFLGVNVDDAGAFPPDSMGAVGPSQVFVCVNGRFRLFDRQGATIPTLDVAPETFFSSVLSTSGLSDPRVKYDRLSQRWFISMIDVLKISNNVYIAVSSGPTLTDSTSFTMFKFAQDANLLRGTDKRGFLDYETLGVDANALYVGGTIFNPNYVASTVFVINKAKLVATPAVLSMTVFRDVANTSTGASPALGVDNDDPSATEGYFIGPDVTSTSTLVMLRVSNPGGATPTISSNINIAVPEFGQSLGINSGSGVPAMGSNFTIDDNDNRLFQASIHNGSLYTAHNIEVDATGTSLRGGGRDGARWYEITGLTGTPGLQQSGTLFDAAATSPRNYIFPSCTVTGQGHMALAATALGTAEFCDIAAAGRLASDPLGTLQPPQIVVASSASYNDPFNHKGTRWGDYSATVVDPNDNMTVWTFQEYTVSQDKWGVRVIQLVAPPPATPTSISPFIVQPTGSNIVLMVTGTSANGSGFYDPGAGFLNHISATVSGTGVTVNSVAYIDPTHVAVTITTANASLGGHSITIINPDGQAVATPAHFFCVSAQNPTLTGITVNGPPVVDTGIQFTFSIAGVDMCGSTFPGYTGNVAISCDDPNAVIPSNYQFLPGDNGSRIFMATFPRLGTTTITVVDATNNFTATLPILVTTPPTISVAPTGTPMPGVAGFPVTFSVTASSAVPTVFAFAWDFGDGSTGTGKQPQHVYAAAGSYNVSVTANDGRGGTASASVSFSVTPPPVFTSGPSAVPNPAGVHQTIAFSASASEVGGDTISYGWAFGDGASDVGANTTHAYSPAGPYTATITASDTRGGQISSTIQIQVNAPLVGIGNDSDGDGFSDDFERIAGSDPNNIQSTPFGASLAGGVQTLTVTKLSTHLNFASSGRDAISLSGMLSLPNGFDPAKNSVGIDIAGVGFASPLDSKGRAGTGGAAFKLHVRSSRGIVSAQQAKFTLNLRNGTFAVALANSGLTNSSVKAMALKITVSVVFNGSVGQANVPQSYTARQGKSGMSR